MNTNRSNTTRNRALVLATGLTMLIAAPIRAHEPKRHSHGNKHRQQHSSLHHRGHHPAPVYAPRHGQTRHYRAPHAFVVAPRHIARHDSARYRPYRHGTVWHAGHRHSHAAYHFPVRSEYGVVYRPHYYCEGQLFFDSRVGYRGSRVSFNIRF